MARRAARLLPGSIERRLTHRVPRVTSSYDPASSGSAQRSVLRKYRLLFVTPCPPPGRQHRQGFAGETPGHTHSSGNLAATSGETVSGPVSRWTPPAPPGPTTTARVRVSSGAQPKRQTPPTRPPRHLPRGAQGSAAAPSASAVPPLPSGGSVGRPPGGLSRLAISGPAAAATAPMGPPVMAPSAVLPRNPRNPKASLPDLLVQVAPAPHIPTICGGGPLTPRYLASQLPQR